MQNNKAHFISWFDKTIQEQSVIRQELIGQSITGIFYTPKVEGWDIDIKDKEVIHLPLGYLTFATSCGNNYRINTNYQSWCGGIFGIMLERIIRIETHNPTVFPLTNQLLLADKWNYIKGAKIKQVDWYWKREPNCKLNGQSLTIKKVQKYLFEDCFLPESLVFHFDNAKSSYFFALEPDKEFVDKKTYKLISGGEEIMIFLDNKKFKNWDITSIGFQIQVD